MRYIHIPEDIAIQIKQPDGTTKEVPTTFYAFVCNTVLEDKKFGRTGKTLRAANRIEAALQAALADNLSVVAIESEDWELLRNAAEEPEAGYISGVARQLTPFMDAISKAEDQPPNKKED